MLLFASDGLMAVAGRSNGGDEPHKNNDFSISKHSAAVFLLAKQAHPLSQC